MFSLHPPELSELYDCLKRKLNILKEFLAATESLGTALDLRNLSKMNDLLYQRQAFIQTIDWIDERIEKVGSRDLLRGEKSSDEWKGKMSFLSKAIEDILQRVKILDQQCLNRMTSWKHDIKNERSKIRSSLKTIHCYSEKSVLRSKFMDAIG